MYKFKNKGLIVSVSNNCSLFGNSLVVKLYNKFYFKYSNWYSKLKNIITFEGNQII